MKTLRRFQIKRFFSYLVAAMMVFLLVAAIALAFMRWFWNDEQPIYPKDLKALLIPTLWSAKSLAAIGEVDHYFVNASDGPKAAETHIFFKNLNVAATSAYLRQAGYQQKGPLQWEKPEFDVILELSNPCPVQCRARLVILDATSMAAETR